MKKCYNLIHKYYHSKLLQYQFNTPLYLQNLQVLFFLHFFIFEINKRGLLNPLICLSKGF